LSSLPLLTWGTRDSESGRCGCRTQHITDCGTTPNDPPSPSWPLQEPQTERREYQNNSDVHYQPLPQMVPEEQDVHADHDGYQREHVKHDGCLSSHRFVLLCATAWSKNALPAWVGGSRRSTWLS